MRTTPFALALLPALGLTLACETGPGRQKPEPAGEEAGETAREDRAETEAEAPTEPPIGAVTRVATRSWEGGGRHLVDGAGMSLYLFTADERGAGESACGEECARDWPPLRVLHGEPATADPALDGSLLGTISRADGATQVTYAGRPLYLYLRDRKPGDTSGRNRNSHGGEWHLVSPAGEKLGS